MREPLSSPKICSLSISHPQQLELVIPAKGYKQEDRSPSVPREHVRKMEACWQTTACTHLIDLRNNSHLSRAAKSDGRDNTGEARMQDARRPTLRLSLCWLKLGTARASTRRKLLFKIFQDVRAVNMSGSAKREDEIGRALIDEFIADGMH